MVTSNPTDTLQNPLVTILKCSSGRWELIKNTSLDPQNILSLPDRCYVFLDKESYPRSECGRGDLLHYFNVPDFLHNRTCTELNGYFGCRGIYNKEGKMESYSTWFRCSVKMLREVHLKTQDGRPYKWYEMGFFTRWDDSGHCRVLCIDTPEELQLGLQTVLRNQSPPLDFNDPFAMHVPLIDQIILLYDISVWRTRDPVREIEKNRLSAGFDFGEMHEIYRHSIHVSESLSVTAEMLEGIRRQQKAIYSSLPPSLTETYREQAQEYMRFQLQIVKSLKLRASSNHERLQNEIKLAYNMINFSITRDSSSMRTIAALTALFLPFTFMAILITTPIFKWPDPPEGQVVVTLPFVIYWVASFVLTLVVGSVMWRLTRVRRLLEETYLKWVKHRSRPFESEFVV